MQNPCLAAIEKDSDDKGLVQFNLLHSNDKRKKRFYIKLTMITSMQHLMQGEERTWREEGSGKKEVFLLDLSKLYIQQSKTDTTCQSVFI